LEREIGYAAVKIGVKMIWKMTNIPGRRVSPAPLLAHFLFWDYWLINGYVNKARPFPGGLFYLGQNRVSFSAATQKNAPA
jgi:hypothetical protein